MAAHATLTSIQLSFVPASISKQLKKKQVLFLPLFFPTPVYPANRGHAPPFRGGGIMASNLEVSGMKKRQHRFQARFYWLILMSRKFTTISARECDVICRGVLGCSG
ncbi:MAG: hypothetical protein NTZ09_10700 [Candidatus Hydrogenedentes bacterium]|nr:hypothetical protein [Candidatus Hydrogenedentota bacterium]